MAMGCFHLRALTSSLVALVFSATAAFAATCPPPIKYDHPGAGQTLSLTYSGASKCEGIDIKLDVPSTGGVFSLALNFNVDLNPLKLLQIFNDDGNSFDLFVDGTATPWLKEFQDRFLYQVADTSAFSTSGDPYVIDFVTSGTGNVGDEATVQLGGSSVVPAIPAPASAVLLLTGLVTVAGIRRRQRPKLVRSG